MVIFMVYDYGGQNLEGSEHGGYDSQNRESFRGLNRRGYESSDRGYGSGIGGLLAAPPRSQIEDQQQAPQQNHANYQQNDQVSQQNYQDWNQYNQQHQGYSDQGTYSYWDGNNYVNYVSHYLHYEKKFTKLV